MKTKFLDEYSCRNSQVDNKTPPFNSMDQVDNKTPQLNSMDKIDNKTPQFNSVDDETNDQLNSEPSQLPEKYHELVKPKNKVVYNKIKFNDVTKDFIKDTKISKRLFYKIVYFAFNQNIILT